MEFISPYDLLKAPVEEPDIVTDSALQCQDCYEVVNNGLYFNKAKVLTWKCSNGHVSRQENFVL